MNYLYCKNNILTKEQCKNIIHYYENTTNKYPGIVGSGVHDPMIKDTIDVSIPYNLDSIQNSTLYEITELISSKIHDQLILYSKNINNNYYNNLIFKTKPILFKGALINKYIKNKGKYIYHNDFQLNTKSHRVITFILYLNDILEGGETEFYGGEFSIKPMEGKLVLFPSTFCFPHRGNIPISDDKYVITGWLESENKSSIYQFNPNTSLRSVYQEPNMLLIDKNNNNDFEKNGYVVVRNGLDQNLLEYIKIQCKLLEKVATSNKDVQVENSFSIYGNIGFDSLLLLLQPILEKNTHLKLEPTYSYMRIYYRDAVLKKHIDRPSCEISTTICIQNDIQPWDIWFEINGEKKVITLNEGDMIIYKGMELAHGRDKYFGNEHIQIFLHYVIQNGIYKDLKYDNRKYLGIQKI